MQSNQVAPTGRRKTTAAMIAAQASRPVSWDEPLSRAEVLRAFRLAARALGICATLIAFIEYLAECTQPCDWLDRFLMAWPKNSTIGDALGGLGRTQVKTLIRLALEYGFIEMRDSSNGRRYGRRENGRIVEAYGFDLSPLAARHAEFKAIAAAHKERRGEAKRIHDQIGAVRNQVLSLTDAGKEQKVPGANWQHLDATARQLAAGRKTVEDPNQLAPILGRLTELHTAVLGILAAFQRVETDPSGPADRPHLTTTKEPFLTKASAVGEGAKPPGQEEKSSRFGANFAKPELDGEREGQRQSALRGFIVTPDFILKIAPTFRGWVTAPRPTWTDLDEAGWLIRSDLGISQHAWGQACVILGRMEAVTVLAVICARHEAGKVRSPGGLLRRMVELHQVDGLRLDRTLFGLADGLGTRRH